MLQLSWLSFNVTSSLEYLVSKALSFVLSVCAFLFLALVLAGDKYLVG